MTSQSTSRGGHRRRALTGATRNRPTTGSLGSRPGCQRGLGALIAQGVDDGTLRVVDGHRFTLAGLAPGKGPYAFFSRYADRGEPGPNWEYFVQVAEYIRIRNAVADRFRVDFEDELMDISVRDGEHVVWCIEVKEQAGQLASLLTGIRQHAQSVDDAAPDRGNDPLRKAKYIVRRRPDFFSLVAIGQRLDFHIEYDGERSFTLVPDVVPIG